MNDELSNIIEDEKYCLLDAMEFAVQSTFFSRLAQSLLEGSAFSGFVAQKRAMTQIGEMMLLQHQSYSKIGLGHFLTDQIVDLLTSLGPDEGIYGARVCGGGSGGTIVILCHNMALPIIENIAKQYKTELII